MLCAGGRWLLWSGQRHRMLQQWDRVRGSVHRQHNVLRRRLLQRFGRRLYKFSPSSGSSLFRSPKVRRAEQVCTGGRAERKEWLSLQVIYPLTCPEVLRAYPHPPHAPMGGHQPAPTCTNLHPTRTRPARGPSSAHLPPIRLREGASVRLGGAVWLWERSGAA